MSSKSVIKAAKQKIVETYGKNGRDTGNTEVQVALLTERINYLNGHFAKNPMDFHSKQGLLKLVGQRKRLLTFLKTESEKRYLSVIGKLEIRK